jgi:hypothetical protein
MAFRRLLCIVTGLLVLGSVARADSSAFDLAGPKMQLRVSRDGKTLPISQVPSLKAGDRLWVQPEIVKGQSAHYLLIAAFLRGTTSPPPEDWITRADTWSKQMQEEGLSITVPQGAQQALLFLAPQTGGDFSSVRNAVRGKPGAFVRAAQDLNQASLDRARLDRYLSAVKQTAETDPAALHDRSVLLARSLNMKLDEQCFDKPSAQQAPCLVQHTDQLVLDDGHGSESLVSTLTSGAGSDLIGQVSATRMAGGGAYSAYVGAVVDVVRLFEGFHTPVYQYIPALALPKRDELTLKLNNPPSFNKPKSVLVIGLPPVEAPQLPKMHPVEENQTSCLQNPSLVLPVKGAPLVFSSELGHDFVLHVEDKSGKSIELPAKADPARGGFVVESAGIKADGLEGQLTGTLRGYWGFQSFDGPAFALRNARSENWTVPDNTTLTAGRDNTIHLQSDGAVCAEQIAVKSEDGRVLKTSWKLAKPDELELQVPLKDEAPGRLTLTVKPYGLEKQDEVTLQVYPEAAQLEQFAINAGDQEGILRGIRLDQVAGLEMNGLRFLPAGLARVNHKDELRLKLPKAAEPPTAAQEPVTAQVTLKDGRVLQLQTTVGTPRPHASLLSRTVQHGPNATTSAIRLTNPNDVPQDERLSFLLKSEVPATFPRTAKIDVATADESFHTQLSFADGSLILQDPHTVLAVLEPLKSMGPSAFGQLKYRVLDGQNKGDWAPLANVVRVPALKEVRCPDDPREQCSLIGTNLFLIDSIDSDPQFTHPEKVPLGYSNSNLTVPRPNGTLLYLRLRDDPESSNPAYLPILPARH